MTGWWLASYLALWGLVAILGLLVVALARQVGTLHLRLGPRGALEVDEEGPPLGEAPPPLQATALDGSPLLVGGPGERRLVMFVSPECPICRDVLPSVPVVARAHDLRPYVVADDDSETARRTYAGVNGTMSVALGPGLAEAYDVPGTPYVVVLDETGTVTAKGTVNNLEQLEGLADTAHAREEAGVTE
ncbi:MAG TPA: methylamine dehydrogenase [Actinomycetota bacterium]|nr:methylamine dehydrogenase [Actinomycetota bacterium]